MIKTNKKLAPSLPPDSLLGGTKRNIAINERLMATTTTTKLARIIMKEHGEFNAVNIATALSMLAKHLDGSRLADSTVREQQKTIEALCKQAHRKIAKFKAGDLANISRSLAALGVKDEELAAPVKAIRELRLALEQKDRDFETFLEANLTRLQIAKYVLFQVEFNRTMGEKLNRARAIMRDRGRF